MAGFSVDTIAAGGGSNLLMTTPSAFPISDQAEPAGAALKLELSAASGCYFCALANGANAGASGGATDGYAVDGTIAGSIQVYATKATGELWQADFPMTLHVKTFRGAAIPVQYDAGAAADPLKAVVNFDAVGSNCKATLGADRTFSTSSTYAAAQQIA